MKETIIERLSKLEDAATDFDDVIGSEADTLRKEYGIEVSAQEMSRYFAELENESRLLNIGIIGKVKAGKSSLLNAIFFEGKDILPTGPTPTTAVLSVMTYSESLSATVEYFSEADIEKIKEKHDAYKKKYDAVKAELAEAAKKQGGSLDLEDVKLQADMKMQDNSNSAAYDQFERISKSGTVLPGKPQSLSASSPDDLFGKLEEYVGANGRMMPFTKSVDIQINSEALRDICVVDTPGLDDPVESREQRTKEYLHKCDVVFIINIAGQFMSGTEVALIANLIREGTQRVYLVASKADGEFFGSPGKETGWNLIKAHGKICSELFSLTESVISGMKQKNPEDAPVLDKLIKGGKESAIITSAICESMLLDYDRRASWDSGKTYVWERFGKHYRDYFDNDNSAKENLKLLSGVNKVKTEIELARKNKDIHIAGKREDYINGQAPNIGNFLRELTETVRRKQVMLKDTDVASLKETKQKIENLVSRATVALDSTFEECLNDFTSETRSAIAEKSRTFFRRVKDGISGHETDVDKEKEVPAPRIGFGFFQAMGFLPDTEIITVKERGLRSGAVSSMVNELVPDLREMLVETVEEKKREWRKDVQVNVMRALNEAIGDSESDIDPFMLKTMLMRVVNNMKLPELDLDERVFHSSCSGVIIGNEVESFMGEVGEYLSGTRKAFDRERDEFLSAMEASAREEKMSARISSQFGEQLETLGRDIENKELTLARLEKCINALESIT